ncbi:MAG: Fic family protein [Lachnospiraceae bacterium]|nr:Fic family protein [Lachnospiraceae bacterium]
MGDNKYCYPNSNVLKNKKDIRSANGLLEAEKLYTAIRLEELQEHPIKGKFDFKHLCKIHQYIFQDIFTWAGQVRSVDIGKGNLFCLVPNIQDYAKGIFETYYPSCYKVRDDREAFVNCLADSYADLNALHPFREGNGRTQREFARELCLKCGYIFDLSVTTHNEMLEASILSFHRGDNSGLKKIFHQAVVPVGEYEFKGREMLTILTADDMEIVPSEDSYDYYE